MRSKGLARVVGRVYGRLVEISRSQQAVVDMEWSEENCLHLIEMYKLHKNLWDPKDKDYFKKGNKIIAWEEVAEAVGSPVEACKKKIMSLMATYRKEKNRVKTSTGTGKGANEVYSSRWFAYEAFQFLEDRDRPRQGLNSEQLVETQDIQESQQEEDGEDLENVPVVNAGPSQSPHVPKPPKRARKQDQLQQKVLTDAINMMRTATQKLNTSSSDTPEEIKSFANYIISKMKSYSEKSRKGVEHAIYDILIKADTGYYEHPIPSTSSAPLTHYMPQLFPTSQYPFTYSRPPTSHPIPYDSHQNISLPTAVDSQYHTNSTHNFQQPTYSSFHASPESSRLQSPDFQITQSSTASLDSPEME